MGPQAQLRQIYQGHYKPTLAKSMNTMNRLNKGKQKSLTDPQEIEFTAWKRRIMSLNKENSKKGNRLCSITEA